MLSAASYLEAGIVIDSPQDPTLSRDGFGPTDIQSALTAPG